MVVQCTVTISSRDYYSCELTRRIPVRVSIITINGETGFGIIESMKNNQEHIIQYIETLRSQPTTKELEITYKSPHACWTRLVHRLQGPSIYDTILQSGCMTRLPIIVESGFQKHVILAPSKKQLSFLLKELRSRFTEVHIQRVKAIPTGVSYSPLTEKQQEAFLLAYGAGYFDIPKATTLSELATKIGIRRVAMQERIQRAVHRIVQDFIETHF